jgi:hypothetical protein
MRGCASGIALSADPTDDRRSAGIKRAVGSCRRRDGSHVSPTSRPQPFTPALGFTCAATALRGWNKARYVSDDELGAEALRMTRATGNASSADGEPSDAHTMTRGHRSSNPEARNTSGTSGLRSLPATWSRPRTPRPESAPALHRMAPSGRGTPQRVDPAGPVGAPELDAVLSSTQCFRGADSLTGSACTTVTRRRRSRTHDPSAVAVRLTACRICGPSRYRAPPTPRVPSPTWRWVGRRGRWPTS